MKTYEEIFNDFIDYHFKNVSPKPVDIRKEAAKEYAKMWVEHVLRNVVDAVPIQTTVDYYINQIDEQ